MGLIVVAEQSDKILLAHKLAQEPIYNRAEGEDAVLFKQDLW